ncbi:MAG: DMT family transporter [Hyphomonadaceae bacterium]|nr:DMT family transporter [Hyphomonadaceae bacterium]
MAQTPEDNSTAPADPPIAAGDFAALLAIAVIWGLNNLFAKVAVDAMPPLLTAGLRFTIALAVLFPLLKAPKAGMGMLALVAILTGLVHQGIQYAGLALATDLAPMVIAMQIWIPASVGFAALWLRERAGPWRLAGMGAAFAGLAAMAGDPAVFSQIGALALVALAAAIYGAAAVLVRRAPVVHPLTYQAWIAAFAAPGLFLASATFETGQMTAMAAAPWTIWAAIAFAALASSVAANALMFRLVQRYAVARTTPYLFLSPLIGVALGVVVLDDPLTWQFLLGGGLTMAGVALVALAERRRA